MKPEVRAVRNEDGTYDVHVLVVAPNGCYSAGDQRVGAPAGMRTIPETEPLTVVVDNSEAAICTMALVPLTYTFQGLRVGPGKSTITVFVVIHGSRSGTDIRDDSTSIHVHEGAAVTLR